MDYEQKTIMIRADVLQRFEIAARMRDETLTLDKFVEAKLIEFSNRVFADADEASGYLADDDWPDIEGANEAPEDKDVFAFMRDIDKRRGLAADAPPEGIQMHRLMAYNPASPAETHASEANTTEEKKKKIILAKMRQKIQKWSEKRDSYPFIIISAYFRCLAHDPIVLSRGLYNEVLDKHPGKSKREVQNNFAQLKTTSGHAHGAVFATTEEGEIVPADGVGAILQEFSDKFVENE